MAARGYNPAALHLQEEILVNPRLLHTARQPQTPNSVIRSPGETTVGQAIKGNGNGRNQRGYKATNPKFQSRFLWPDTGEKLLNQPHLQYLRI